MNPINQNINQNSNNDSAVINNDNDSDSSYDSDSDSSWEYLADRFDVENQNSNNDSAVINNDNDNDNNSDSDSDSSWGDSRSGGTDEYWDRKNEERLAARASYCHYASSNFDTEDDADDDFNDDFGNDSDSGTDDESQIRFTNPDTPDNYRKVERERFWLRKVGSRFRIPGNFETDFSKIHPAFKGCTMEREAGLPWDVMTSNEKMFCKSLKGHNKHGNYFQRSNLQPASSDETLIDYMNMKRKKRGMPLLK